MLLPHSRSHASAALSRKALIWLSIPVMLILFLGGCYWQAKAAETRARRTWKNITLPKLASLSVTNEAIRQELETISAASGMSDGRAWIEQHVLVMTNGEALLFAWRHGANNGFVDHLFLAHGSNGRWYYSTYHFCGSMAGAMGDPPPGSIAEFATRYAVREFDGQSDECLKKTWP